MRILIEQQAVIDCLTNTAKYYEREDADEWTKGIHYGLLHGVDNILDDVPTVEAILKADYENRLKADMVAILTEIQLEIEEIPLIESANSYRDERYKYLPDFRLDVYKIIQQKINALPKP